MRIALVFGVALMISPVSLAGAQELATSFDQLRVLVKAGDTLTVTDTGGHEFRGQISGLSSTALDIIVDGQSRALRASDVTTIRVKREDSLGNGAKKGFIVGAVLGLLAGVSLVGEFDSAGIIPLSVLLYGGLGTSVGVGIDALTQSNNVIFAQQNGRTVTLNATPILGPRARGMRVAIGF